MTISERIMHLLEAQGKKAKELAQFLGVDASSVTGWARGSFPSSKYIVGISQFLSVTPHFLLTGEDRNVDDNGLSDEALEVAKLWDTLDTAGKAITKGEIYRRAESQTQGWAQAKWARGLVVIKDRIDNVIYIFFAD